MNSVFDRALSEIGSGGYFQKKYDCIINVAFSAVWSVIYLQMLVVLVIVPHTCKLPEKALNVTDEAWKLKYIPYQRLNGEIKYESCLIYISPEDNNLTSSCKEYEYDRTWYESTVSIEKNWVCDKELYIMNIIAYSKVMELIGSTFFGWMSDIYGRRFIHIVTMVLTVVGRIVSLLADTSYFMFLTGCLLSSFALWSAMQSALVITVEITSSERRSMLTSLRSTTGSIGVAIMPFIFWWIKDWKMFIIITTAPLIIFIIFSWNMIESPRWLHTNAKTKKCVEQLKRIAKENGKILNPETEKELLGYIPQKTNKSLGPLTLFSRRSLAINTILHLVMWKLVRVATRMNFIATQLHSSLISFLTNDTIILSIRGKDPLTAGSTCNAVQILSIGQDPGGNPYLELCWQTLSEIPATCISGWLANKIGRRYSGAMSFFMMSIAWLLIGLRETCSYTWVRIWWLGSIFNIVIRVFNAIAYIVSSLLCFELYPTCVRQSGMALGNVFSSVGSVIAPCIYFLARRIDERLPGLIVSGMCVSATLAALFLPETRNTKLPETLDEAESLRQKKQYSSVSLKITSS